MDSAKTRIITEQKVLAWALYDWGNSAFATTVMAGFFPLFFKNYWSHGVEPTMSTFYLGLANSLSSGLLAVLSPFLGCLADQGGLRKHLLFIFSSLGMISAAALTAVPMGFWQMAAIVYAIGMFGFFGANVFYDALLVRVAKPNEFDLVSGFGYALGYLGGGILFTANVLMHTHPEWFGLSDGIQGVRWSFATVAVWWFIFTLPILYFVQDTKPQRLHHLRPLFAQSWQTLRSTLRELQRYRGAFIFLLAFLFYNEGVNTVIKMAVDYGTALGFPSKSLITALLLVQFIGFPAAIAFGILGARIGPLKGIWICLAVYAVITVYAYQMQKVYEFYVLAGGVGLVQGGIQSLSRSYFARLVPPQQAAEFFGFFNMLGKFSAIFGPLLVGLVAAVTKDSRTSILVILVFFALGSWFLRKSVEPAKS